MQSEHAGVTVEFVALMPAFLLLTFFILEVAVALTWIGTAEKAVQLGARLAVVSNYAVGGLAPTNTNALAAGHLMGQPCSAGACTAFAMQTCIHGTSGQCDATNFNAIVDRIRSCSTCSGISSLISAQYVTITYSYVGLGYAGGPLVPQVTVQVAGVPYGTIVTTLLGNFFKRASGNQSYSSGLTNLPTITVTLTGEDQSSAGAG